MIDRPITISLYDTHPDGRPTCETSRVSARLDTTVTDLLTSLTEHLECAAKHTAPAWSPVTYSGGARKAADAVSVCALVYDLDSPDLEWERLGARLTKLGWRYAIHETWTRGRARLIVPLAEDLPARDYASVYETTARDLGVWEVCDQSCRDLARLFYAPSHPHGESRISEVGGGDLLKPSVPNGMLTQRAKPRDPTPSTAGVNRISEAPKNQKNFDLGGLLAELCDSKSPHAQAMIDLVNGTLRVPPGQRENLLHPVVSALACARHAPPAEVARGLLERVLSMRDGADEHLEAWVNKAMDSYTRGAEWAAKREEGKAAVEKFFRDETWRTSLKQNVSKDGEVRGLKPTEGNILKVLRNDEDWKGSIRWNVLKQRLEVVGGALGGLHENARESYALPATEWFQDSKYNCEVSSDRVGACMEHVALENPYDPVRNYLNALPKWDKKRRLSGLLTDYADASGDPAWVQLITRKFFIAAVARQMEPGCQVDNVLVLQGAQGGGKTSLVRIMGAGFHVETSLDLQNKDAVMTAAGNWLVELGELASLKRAEVEHVRNFITRREDQIRLPYGRAIKTMPRRCVFIGTTNSRQPLTDPEGNRRYWVVSVGNVNTGALERDRDQLWAEALHYYNAGEQWHLTTEESKRAAREARVYEAEDVTRQEILSWMFNAKEWPEEINALTVFRKVLQKPVASIAPHEAVNVNRTLATFGWKRTRKRINKVLQYVYEVPPREVVERDLDLDLGIGEDKVTA